MSPYQTQKQTTGFTLIEVLVAVFVLSVGLLGLAMLQIQSMQANTDAISRTQASLIAYDIIDRMRANPTAAGAGSYHVPDEAAITTKTTTYGTCGTSCNCATATCSSAQLALYDLGKWYEEQAALLPAGTTRSTITRNGNRHTIVIRWRERDLPMEQEWIVEL